MTTQDREQKLMAYAELRRARGVYAKPKNHVSRGNTVSS
jgi:hypothetical protein